jgi:hypothetical protein
MDKDYKPEQNETVSDEKELLTRREYIISLKKWSRVVIGSVLLGGLLTRADKEVEAGGAWVNRRGGWINGVVSGGGGGWVNARGGGGWINR